MTITRRTLLKSAVASAAACAHPAFSQTREQLKVGYLHTPAVDGQIWVGQRIGAFAAQDLSLNMVQFTSGLELFQAMIGGSLDVVSTGAVLSNFPARGQGKVFLLNNIEYATAQLWVNDSIRTLADLKGKRIQGSGEYDTFIVELGGLPMSLTATEFYTGLSQGTLDCIIGTVAWLTTYGLMDVINYVVDEPFSPVRPLNQMNINLGKWNRLSQGEQKIFTDGLAKLVANSAYGYVEEHNAAHQAGVAAGIKFAPPFPGFNAAFDKVMREGSDRFLTLAKEKGVKEQDAQRLLDRYLEIAQQWREIVANAKSQADYEKALEERIFSKVKWPTK